MKLYTVTVNNIPTVFNDRQSAVNFANFKASEFKTETDLYDRRYLLKDAKFNTLNIKEHDQNSKTVLISDETNDIERRITITETEL